MSPNRRPGPSVRTRVREVRDTGAVVREDRLATEEPLEIRCSWPGVDAHRVAVTMRTPGHDFELATGFLFAEGVVGGQEHLRTVAYCTDRTLTPEQEFNVVTVDLAGPPLRHPSVRYGGLAGASSACRCAGPRASTTCWRWCAPPDPRPCRDPEPVDRALVHTLPDRLREAQKVFASTGGLHAAGLFTAHGEPLVVREDIGRHNAVDKVVGQRLLAGASTAVPVLAVSGRIGFEIVQKAVAAGVGLLAAVGALSSLAVDLARRAGLCTVGFVGADRFVVYSAPERLGV